MRSWAASGAGSPLPACVRRRTGNGCCAHSGRLRPTFGGRVVADAAMPAVHCSVTLTLLCRPCLPHPAHNGTHSPTAKQGWCALRERASHTPLHALTPVPCRGGVPRVMDLSYNAWTGAFPSWLLTQVPRALAACDCPIYVDVNGPDTQLTCPEITPEVRNATSVAEAYYVTRANFSCYDAAVGKEVGQVGGGWGSIYASGGWRGSVFAVCVLGGWARRRGACPECM